MSKLFSLLMPARVFSGENIGKLKLLDASPVRVSHRRID
jgi:hypothetical protein